MIPFSSVRGGAQLSSRFVEEGLMHVTSWGGGMDSYWVGLIVCVEAAVVSFSVVVDDNVWK